MKHLFFAVLAVSLSSAIAQAGIYDSLTGEEKAAVNNGEQVTRTEDVAGSVWPRITVIQRIDATSDQVAAVMFDYPLHTQMFEGITRANPEKPGAAVTNIDYQMTLPKVLGITLPPEDYVVTDRLTSSAPGSYEISWTMVRATSMQDTQGSVKFEKLGTGMIISYTSLISPPKPQLAKLIVKLAIGRVQDSVKALNKQVQAERTGDTAKLNTQISILNKALGR
jgi:hypothetical protein